MTAQYQALSLDCAFPAGMLDWFPQRTFKPEPVTKRLPETVSPSVASVAINDAGRTWSTSQAITVSFSEAVTTDGTGWSCTVNGVSKAIAYTSGSGTIQVVFTVSSLIRHGDVFRLSYDTATGATVSVSGSAEITSLTTVPLADQLTKRVRFTLCDSTDAVVNETVKAALLEYDSGTVANANWGVLANKASAVVTAGQFDMLYTGAGVLGGGVYAVVFRATETLAVQTTVT